MIWCSGAAEVWIAPGDVGEAADAYHVAGQVMLAQSDLLIALWDGQAGRGIGGTAFVVAQAVREGLPVIHIRLDGAETEAIWAIIASGIGVGWTIVIWPNSFGPCVA